MRVFADFEAGAEHCGARATRRRPRRWDVIGHEIHHAATAGVNDLF